MRRERLRRVLDGAHEERAQEVPVLERRLLDRRAAAPAADEVDEPVDAAVVPRGEIVGPRLRRRGVEEVDDVGLDRRLDLRRERVEALLVATADARARAVLRESPDDGRAEIACAAGDSDHASVERVRHAATLATVRRARSSVRAWQSRRSPSSRRSSASIWPTVTLRSIGDVERTVVVVHSISFDVPDQLIPVFPAYEERFLCLVLSLLRAPRSRVVYVTSQPIHPRVARLLLRARPRARHARGAQPLRRGLARRRPQRAAVAEAPRAARRDRADPRLDRRARSSR